MKKNCTCYLEHAIHILLNNKNVQNFAELFIVMLFWIITGDQDSGEKSWMAEMKVFQYKMMSMLSLRDMIFLDVLMKWALKYTWIC